MEERTNIIWIKREYRCDEEGCSGFHRPTGFVLTCNPPMFRHECNACGKMKNFKARYPVLEYKEVTDGKPE